MFKRVHLAANHPCHVRSRLMRDGRALRHRRKPGIQPILTVGPWRFHATLEESGGTSGPPFVGREPSREFHWAGPPGLGSQDGALMGERLNMGRFSDELHDALEELARLAWDAVPGCDGASVSVVQEHSVSTLAATQRRITDIDKAQYRHGDGPCVAAIRDNKTVSVEDYRSERRWPGVAAEASAAGICRSLSLPLVTSRGQTLGGLNMYGDARAAFGAASRRSAEGFARQATLLLTQLQLLHTNAPPGPASTRWPPPCSAPCCRPCRSCPGSPAPPATWSAPNRPRSAVTGTTCSRCPTGRSGSRSATSWTTTWPPRPRWGSCAACCGPTPTRAAAPRWCWTGSTGWCRGSRWRKSPPRSSAACSATTRVSPCCSRTPDTFRRSSGITTAAFTRSVVVPPH